MYLKLLISHTNAWQQTHAYKEETELGLLFNYQVKTIANLHLIYSESDDVTDVEHLFYTMDHLVAEQSCQSLWSHTCIRKQLMDKCTLENIPEDLKFLCH